MNSKNASDCVDVDGWIDMKFKRGIVSKLFRAKYNMERLTVVSPSGRFAVFIRRAVKINLVDQARWKFQRHLDVDNIKYVDVIKLYILDLSQMKLKQYWMDDGSAMQVVNGCYWLSDNSLVIVTLNPSSYTQKQYRINHETCKLTVTNTYESMVPGPPVIFHISELHHLYIKPIEIQGTKFIIVRRRYERYMCLLPYYLHRTGPKYPPIRLHFSEVEKDNLSRLSGQVIVHNGNIYFPTVQEEGDEITYPLDKYFVYDLNKINLLKTETHFMNNAIIHRATYNGQMPINLKWYCMVGQVDNIVTLREIYNEGSNLLRFWIWDMNENTIKQHKICVPRNTDSVGNHNGIMLAIRYPSRNNVKQLRGSLRIKILPGGRGTFPKLKDLCSTTIMHNPKLLKELEDMKHFIF